MISTPSLSGVDPLRRALRQLTGGWVEVSRGCFGGRL